MNLVVNIVIAIAVAAVASALTAWSSSESHGAWLLFGAFAAATIVTALLVSVADRRPAAGTARTGDRKRPAAVAKAAPRPVASAGPREEGRVKWFNVSKGFGFITKDDGEEIFVHFRSIRGGGRRGLRDGQRVSFIVADSDKGPQAEDVTGID